MFTLQLNILTITFLLVRCSKTFQNLLWFVQGQGQKYQQKHITKNLDRLHNHCQFINYVNRKHLITMSIPYNCFQLFTLCPLYLYMKALFLVPLFSLLRKSNPVPFTRAQSSGCFLRRRDLFFTPDGALRNFTV